MRCAALLCLFLLAACGAEGPPTYVAQPEPGLRVSGELRMGVRGEL